MRDDELRDRLRRVDPAATAPSADRAGTARAQSLLEGIMATPVDTTTTADAPAARPATSRRWLVPVAAAAGVGAIALSAALLVGGGDEPAPRRTTAALLKLTAPASEGGGTTMSSCLMFDEKILADMPTAFGGTVTSVGAGTVVLDVDRWFKPAESDVKTVEVSAATGDTVSIDQVEFVEGKRYLVTAAQDGTVNSCGYSGEATAEYEASFERAFGAG